MYSVHFFAFCFLLQVLPQLSDFLHHYSTQVALDEVTKDICSATSSQQLSVLILLDISGAYNKAYHSLHLMALPF